MSKRKPAAPPRPLAPGDVVAAYSRHLDEWTAAQIIRLDPATQTAAVLDLTWSGPEPSSLSDLGDVAPLALTHHTWNGTLSYCNKEWLLPRSHKVIGTIPPLLDQPADMWGSGWHLGLQLAYQRRWDNGIREDPVGSWRAAYTGETLNEFFGRSAEPRSEVKHLSVREVDSLDCERLVRCFPALTDLDLYGRLGTLTAAHSLNGLASLRRIGIVDLFGMTKDDRLTPSRVPELESVKLHGIPAEYASVMRTTWNPEIPKGVLVSVIGVRTPEWVEENRNNPLRDWDGRDGIGGATYKKSVAEYKTTRRSILKTLAEDPAGLWPARLEEIGRAYGEAFNALDHRAGFIMTVEREELYEALDHIMAEAETLQGLDLRDAREHLFSGVDATRDW
ncbi:hypothetical protein [Sinosporangium siamense]|uniref:Uncharacterized protein n=1 Tax=Sinosporangium siamense TaxID=1367973 RepID=A0A919V8D4_9ACTN|nr:hypothetical protein [Sinosporangium siamense]GII94338.1 hypothetical protein Ssi02_45690 [Sinosporangium siamense]